MSELTTHVEVRTGAYYDSVTLLGVSQRVQQVDGVDRAVVAMATQLNLDVLADLGFDDDALGRATPNDLVIAVRARADAIAGALAQVEQALATQGAAADTGGERPPRTVGAAARGGDAGLALISVPGPYAFVEAMDALRAGLHVMLFSDNVPVSQEVALKAEAAKRDLLVMGPDCGTAIIGGVGLGFANVVRPGPVGVVAASGTGAQQVCCLLDAAGVGVRHVLGTGGRDLSAQVGAAATLRALAALDDDPGVEVIVLVSKPPDPDVAARVRDHVAGCATPVVEGFVGPGMPDLTAVTAAVLERLGAGPLEPARWAPPDDPAGEPSRGPAVLRGLFSGGTLCDEALVIASAALGPVASNIPLTPDGPRATWVTGGGDDPGGHALIDYGDDTFTRGRPHPMIDHSLRLAALDHEARQPGDRVLLLDVVLGHGAEADPAAAFAPAIAAARAQAADRGDRLSVVVSLCGTAGDPQDLQRQARELAGAGAVVHLSNAAAAREAVALTTGGRP